MTEEHNLIEKFDEFLCADEGHHSKCSTPNSCRCQCHKYRTKPPNMHKVPCDAAWCNDVATSECDICHRAFCDRDYKTHLCSIEV